MLGSGGNGWCWSGMVSLALKWRLPAREHCCFCTPHAAAGFQRYLSMSFHMRIYFWGRTTHAHTEFTMKNLFALLWGGLQPTAWVLCPDLQRERNTYVAEGSVKLSMIHPYSDPQLAVFTIPAVNVSVSPKRSTSPGFPRLKPWMKRWEHPFRTDTVPSFLSQVCPFSSQNPNHFVTGTSCRWTLEGTWGKPLWPAWLLGLCLLQVWIYNNLSRSQMGTRLFWGGVELPDNLST